MQEFTLAGGWKIPGNGNTDIFLLKTDLNHYDNPEKKRICAKNLTSCLTSDLNRYTKENK